MSEFALSVSPQEAKKIAEIIRKIATGGREKLTVNPEPMTSWEMSKIFTGSIRLFSTGLQSLSVLMRQTMRRRSSQRPRENTEEGWSIRFGI